MKLLLTILFFSVTLLVSAKTITAGSNEQVKTLKQHSALQKITIPSG